MERNVYENIGLSTKEAECRKKNKTKNTKTDTYFKIICRNFLTTFNLFFIAISIVYLVIGVVFN